MSPIVFFGIIHEFYCTILANFYLYLQYFQQKKFNFSKINGSQMEPKSGLKHMLWKSLKIFEVEKTRLSESGAYARYKKLAPE